MCQARIEDLTQNFNQYLEVFSIRNQYSGPSIYFHNRIMEILQESSLEDLQDSISFSEYVYAVLVSWGMHRMDRGAQLKNFPEFRNVIRNFIQSLIPISNLTITELNEDIISNIIALFENNSVMHSVPRLVGNSKALHHILPKVFPPIDKKSTLWFFNLPNNLNQEIDNFRFIINKYQQIISAINWNEIHYNGLMNYTEIKKIDNAIIGYRLSQNNLM